MVECEDRRSLRFARPASIPDRTPWRSIFHSSSDGCYSCRVLFNDAHFGFSNHVIHYLLKVAGFVEDAQLAVGAGAHFEDLMNVVDLLPGTQLVDNVVHEM